MSYSSDREQNRLVYQADNAGARTYIPAREKTDIYADKRIFRACAYCRVSTDNDAQLSSFELQQSHYKQLAGNHPNWDLRHIYADEGISGTSLKNRVQFNQMIAACRRGEYDLIITKSVSRFARNLVDCISLIRELKHQNPPVGVFFETDNLNTLSEESELMLAFLATFAQEESVKKSESMNWSLKERFKSGKLLTPGLLGYERPRDAVGNYIKYGKLQIVESEAEIVRFIFDAFLAGQSQQDIAAFLTDIGVPTKTGLDTWSEGTITYILRNERYCGNVLTWKTFTADMFEHKKRRNRRDRDQYLYTEDHDAIVSVEVFEAAQKVLENRKHGATDGYPFMRVIDDGVFRGFVPINHHWINEDPAVYFDASNEVRRRSGPSRISRRSISNFDLGGYEVVHGQFLTSRPGCPTLTVQNGKITFNIDAVRRFQNVGYVQLLLHPTERKMAIRPCAENSPHSIRWRKDPSKQITPKILTCQAFCKALSEIMDWQPDYTYRVRGTWIERAGSEIIVFVLSNAMPCVVTPVETEGVARRRRTELCPEEWGDSFGDEFYEHTLENSFYYLSNSYNWNASASSRVVDGLSPIRVLSSQELQDRQQSLRERLVAANG